MTYYIQFHHNSTIGDFEQCHCFVLKQQRKRSYSPEQSGHEKSAVYI